MAWKAIGSPNLEPTLSRLLEFNKNTSEPLGVLPQFPITLGRKIASINIMVMHNLLDFSFFLDHDYIYFMKDFVSTLFWVMHFSHVGNIMIVDHLSFTNNWKTFSHPISLSVPNVQVVSHPP